MFIKLPKDIQKKEGMLQYNGVFGGVEEIVKTDDFKGLNANAVFGSVELDLRDIELKDENCAINLSSIFGGITILLPENYNVVIGESMAIFGGTDNKFKNKNEEGKKTIYVNARVIFAGIELK